MTTRIDDIIEYLNCEVIGDIRSMELVSMLAINDPNFKGNHLGWCATKNAHLLKEVTGGYIIVSEEITDTIKDTYKHLVFLVVEHPRKAFAKVIKEFFAPKQVMGFVANSAIVSSEVKYNTEEVYIGENVVIEDNCSLGNHIVIGHNTVIKAGTQIADNVLIGSNCTIGGVGFGYEQAEDGTYDFIPHIGNVVLEEYVEIGNNVCIDRAVMGSTILRENVKVDNLVHIAHGVEVGKNSLVIANAMIAGSVKIGENVWVAPSSSVRQKLTIGDNSLIGLGSVVVKDVNASDIVAGVPAKSLKKK